MFHKFYIKTEDKFNKNNFDDWFFSIKYILSFKEVYSYTEEEIISQIRAKN